MPGSSEVETRTVSNNTQASLSPTSADKILESDKVTAAEQEVKLTRIARDKALEVFQKIEEMELVCVALI